MIKALLLWHLCALGAASVSAQLLDDLPFQLDDFAMGLKDQGYSEEAWHRAKTANVKRAPVLGTTYTLRSGPDLQVAAMQLQVVDINSILVLDKLEKNPGRVGTHPGWVEWRNLASSQSVILDAQTNSFCAGGSYLGNGTLVSVGGNAAITSGYFKDSSGLQGLRLFNTCNDKGCGIGEWVSRTRLAVDRWYPTSVKLNDCSILIAGGTKTNGFNNNPTNDQPNVEFYPTKSLNQGMPIYSQFLHDALNSNLFPVMYPMPDGRIFIAANTKAMLYSWQTNTETRLADIPDRVRLTYPFTAATALLPMTSANNWTPEVLICGGSTIYDKQASNKISSQTPASRYCYRMVTTAAGAAKGWKRDTQLLPEARIMGEITILPTGLLLILNGAVGFSGSSKYTRKLKVFAGYGNVYDQAGGPTSASNADKPAFRGVIYDYTLPAGKRMSTLGMPTSKIARMYHSVTTLLPSGEVFIAGSNPNKDVTNKNNSPAYGTEYRTEYLTPPYMAAPKPKMSGLPAQLLYNTSYKIRVDPLPTGSVANSTTLKFALMDLGYHTHSLSMNQRYVELKLESANSKWVTFTSPVNSDLFPPGPAWLFMVLDGIPSVGVKLMVGNGASPPFDAVANAYMLSQTKNPASSS